MQWYVLKVQSNRERSIREALLKRIKQEQLGLYFGEVLIPVERVIDTKSASKRVAEQKLFPGYLMIQMDLNDETWLLVRSTAGVGDFTGTSGHPIPMTDDEVERVLTRQNLHTTAVAIAPLEYTVGDVVKIKEGAFEGFEGKVDHVDRSISKVTVLIEIFGRPTPVELEFWQVQSP